MAAQTETNVAPPNGELRLSDVDLVRRDPVAAVNELENKKPKDEVFDAKIDIVETARLLPPPPIVTGQREHKRSQAPASSSSAAPTPLIQMPPSRDDARPPPAAAAVSTAETEDEQRRKTRCNLQLMSVALLVGFTTVMLLVAQFPSFSDGGNSNDSNLDSRLVLTALCDGHVGAPTTYMFSLFDPARNDTHTIYVHTARKTQVTQLLRRGQIIYSEMVSDTQVAIFPSGPASSSRPADCVLRARDPVRDVRWIDDVACAHEPVAFAHMQTLSDPLPVTLPESM